MHFKFATNKKMSHWIGIFLKLPRTYCTER